MRLFSRVVTITWVPLASLGLLWVFASGASCANGSTPLGTGGATTSTTSTTTTTTSSSTGGGGAGTTTSTTTTTTTTSSSSTGGAGTTTSTTSSTSSSGLGGPNIVQLSASDDALIGESFNAQSMMGGFATQFGDNTEDAIGLAFTGAGQGVAVARSLFFPDAGTDGELHYAVWNGGTWNPGMGDPWLAVQTGLDILGGPSIAGSAQRAHCAFQGVDMKYYYAEFFNNAWSPTDQPITAGGAQSTGPTPPGIVTLANNPIIAYVGNDGDLHDQALLAGVWQPQHAHGLTGVASPTPAIVALTQGPELLVVFTNAAAQDLMFTTRTAGTWSTPGLVPGASSADQVALAPLAAGGAVLSWRGTDMLLYTSLFSAGSAGAWSVPTTGVMGTNPTLVSPPAVATGATGAQAELLYVDSAFDLRSARMMNGAWGTPALLGGASYRLAVATGN